MCVHLVVVVFGLNQLHNWWQLASHAAHLLLWQQNGGPFLFFPRATCRNVPPSNIKAKNNLSCSTSPHWYIRNNTLSDIISRKKIPPRIQANDSHRLYCTVEAGLDFVRERSLTVMSGYVTKWVQTKRNHPAGGWLSFLSHSVSERDIGSEAELSSSSSSSCFCYCCWCSVDSVADWGYNTAVVWGGLCEVCVCFGKLMSPGSDAPAVES